MNYYLYIKMHAHHLSWLLISQFTTRYRSHCLWNLLHACEHSCMLHRNITHRLLKISHWARKLIGLHIPNLYRRLTKALACKARIIMQNTHTSPTFHIPFPLLQISLSVCRGQTLIKSYLCSLRYKTELRNQDNLLWILVHVVLYCFIVILYTHEHVVSQFTI